MKEHDMGGLFLRHLVKTAGDEIRALLQDPGIKQDLKDVLESGGGISR